MTIKAVFFSFLLIVSLVLGSCDDDPANDAGANDADVSDADGLEDDADDDGEVGDGGDEDDGGETPDSDTDIEPPLSRPAAPPLIQWVDPFIGTGGLGFGVGSTFPGPQVPFGMVRPGPDTTGLESAPDPSHCAGYWYQDAYLRGFSNTRAHGMGGAEYGAVALMPTIGMDSSKTSWQGYRSRYSHDTEEASPGYYAVTVEPSNVKVELTATARVGLHRYTFEPSAGTEAVLIVNIAHALADIEIIDGRVEVDSEAAEVFGYATFSSGYSGRFGGMPVYFLMRFSRSFSTHGVWQAGTLYEGETTRTGADTGAWLAFDASDDPVVDVAVGISFVDEAHARMNLDAEVPVFDFEGVREAAEAQWEEALAVVEIEGRSERDFTIFYTALYHVLLMPTLAMDVDNQYRGIDQEVHTAEGFTYYTDFSLWDTYRTQHPLLTFLYPHWQTQMLRSLIAMGRDGGYMPRWPLGIGYTGGMVGDSANIVFADSWAKGVQDFDLREAYDIMMITAMGPTAEGAPYGGRGGIEGYIDLGYVPIEASGGSASRTLEFAYNDFALAQLAGSLGESGDRELFMNRSESWRNLLDPASGFLIGRHQDGSFAAEVDPMAWQDFYAEGNAWQYLWFVPHDLEGLSEALGGRETFFERLDLFFESSADEDYMPILPAPYYWHGNEPDIHAAWVYAALDRPADTARWVRWVLDRHYGDGPDGLPGNDDAGTLSAWYVFSAAGVFPIAGMDDYLIGSPIFTRSVFHLEGGDFVVDAPNASVRDLYVRSATLGDIPQDNARLRYDRLPGSTLHLDLGPEPSDWGQ